MENLAIIEFVAFIGIVIWLFTLPSSPLRRDKSDADGSADPSAEQKSE
jgi:hypothetical protein